MAIQKIGSDHVRPLSAREPVSGAKSDTKGKAQVERADRVEFSTQGRSLAAKSVDEAPASAVVRNETIRSRIDSGYYNDPAVVEKVASHLIASGDLQALP